MTLKRAKKGEIEEEERSGNVCPPWKPTASSSSSSCNGYSEVLTCVTSSSPYTDVFLSGWDDGTQALRRSARAAGSQNTSDTVRVSLKPKYVTL